MATYFLSHAGEASGTTPPSNFTERWTASGNWGTNTDCAEHLGTGSFVYDFLSWDTPGDVSGDAEILVLVRTTVATGNNCGVVIQGSTAATTGYTVSFATSGTNLQITRLDAGTEGTFTSAAFTWAANTDYWIRAGRSGNDIRAKAWADGGSEPGSWTVTLTDTTYSSGRLGYFARYGFTDVQFDQIGVGTGGDTAPSSGAGSFTITADSGSYTLTGQSANPLYTRIMAAAQGSYTLTGVAALLVRTGSYQFTAEAGAYTLVGANALVDVSMNASSGTYTLTGQAATLTFGSFSNPSLTADAGTYALTGFAANINYGRIMPAEVGAYTLTGRQVGLTWSGAPVATGYASQKMTISSLRISL